MDALPLNGADIALLVILGLSSLVGLWRGFIVEVLSLAAWVLAFWLAFTYGDEAAALIDESFATPSARLLIGYALLFVAALLIGGFATWGIGRLVKGSGLSAVDRVLGMGFGLLRGVALCWVLVLLLGFTPFPQDPWWQASRLLPTFEPGAAWLRERLPAPVAEHIRFASDAAAPPTLLRALLPGAGEGVPGAASGPEADGARERDSAAPERDDGRAPADRERDRTPRDRERAPAARPAEPPR